MSAVALAGLLLSACQPVDSEPTPTLYRLPTEAAESAATPDLTGDQDSMVITPYFPDPFKPTPSPTPTSNLIGGAAETIVITRPMYGDCELGANFIGDVTIPDNTRLDPGISFNKVWRMRNTGTCTWNEAYSLVFYDGENLSQTTIIPLRVTAPGETLDISVEMISPIQPGEHIGIWQMQAPDGTPFGTNPYVRIYVTGGPPTPIPPGAAGGGNWQPTINLNNVPALSGISTNVHNIYARGLRAGNRPELFSKVGDSITQAWHFLRPFGEGLYNLGGYGNLQGVVEYYTQTPSLTGYSFNTESFAAIPGWTAADLIDPAQADPACGGKMPLECEYDAVRPAVAIIMIGTNECHMFTPLESFRAQLEYIVSYTISRGIIPVLTTIPWSTYCDTRTQNEQIVLTAWGYDVPLINYWLEMEKAPNHGVAEDGVHPSVPPDFNSGIFDADHLQYGYTIRNLLTLQMLDQIWRQVMN